MSGGSARLRGVALYLGAVGVFSSMDAVTKFLVIGLPTLEVMWARFGFHLLVMAVALRVVRGPLPWRARVPGVQVVRSLSLALCNLLFALALRSVPLADATAINFVGPVVTVALAAIWLRETVGWRRWVGVALGMVGVAIVLRPGPAMGDPAGLFAFASACMFAVYQILTRKLAGRDSAQTTILHTGIWATLGTTLALPLVWVWPGWAALGLMVLLGALGGFGHYLLVLAYERAPASVIAPLGYCGLIFAVTYGMMLFGELPNLAMLAGAAVIAGGGLVVISAERPTPLPERSARENLAA